VGGAIEIETVKPVSQSYLTSLWNHETFRKDRRDNLNTLTNRYSRRFTKIVIAVAIGAALAWAVSGNPGRGLKAFTSVLIVACPCALALAAPFALGTAQRLLANRQVFLKNILVLERLADVDTIVFDKTGTLTTAQSQEVVFRSARPGSNSDLTRTEQQWVRTLSSHSIHPHSRQISNSLRGAEMRELAVVDFVEVPGSGVRGTVQGHEVRLGSREWLERSAILNVSAVEMPAGGVSYLAIDGEFRGAFLVTNALRPQTDRLVTELGQRYELALLTGDKERERARFLQLFKGYARLHFNQSPLDKLGFVGQLQKSGKSVMMVGDGLNDAGALKQSDVGVAVVEKVGVFSPASDIILEAGRVSSLVQILDFARKATRVVRLSFGISGLYNLAGISIAAAGVLSPLICAVLMPLSSLTVILFACGVTTWAARRCGLGSNSLPAVHPSLGT
jgi:Cu+-exporting ATPase